MFSSLKSQAQAFLEPYKQKEPATYAAAEQAIGALLITDGFIGINHPFGGKKRPGIFGTIVGMFFAVVFMLIPSFFGNIMDLNNMTATTKATVVAVGTNMQTGSNHSASCSLTVSYTVNGTPFTQQSGVDSGNYCGLYQGQVITINYDPANPGLWVYGGKTIGTVLQIFFWVGLLLLLSSIVTFFIRLFSIIFGWKLLMDGRKNAAALSQGTNLQTMIDEIKKSFISNLFGFGNSTTAPNV